MQGVNGHPGQLALVDLLDPAQIPLVARWRLPIRRDAMCFPILWHSSMIELRRSTTVPRTSAPSDTQLASSPVLDRTEGVVAPGRVGSHRRGEARTGWSQRTRGIRPRAVDHVPRRCALLRHRALVSVARSVIDACRGDGFRRSRRSAIAARWPAARTDDAPRDARALERPSFIAQGQSQGGDSSTASSAPRVSFRRSSPA